ncbi:hypothetical protein X777_01197 [Ooceraea biroi]|uniref:DUF4371 domain-containing protein n=1 Tax=Ooceraea biroi TaxID=2015173 RepID=A0A026WQE5_OOCBI|nr:hypothetical protein X777_01197 [Ooceraea biroi]
MACNKTINCRKSDLIKHSRTVKHIESVNSSNYEVLPDNENILSHKDKDKVKRAEIKLAAFFAEHNVAFSTVDHLIPLLKYICINPEIVQDLSLARKKCSSIVKNVIAKFETEKVVEILKASKFSVLIDETTDISDNKIMCILVRYVSPVTKKMSTRLLKLLHLDAADCSASKLFESFKSCLMVMVGCNNSFMTHLKSEVPELITLNCICHSSALIASKACAKLPSSCEDLIKGVATYISGSARRCAILVELQEFFNTYIYMYAHCIYTHTSKNIQVKKEIFRKLLRVTGGTHWRFT